MAENEFVPVEPTQSELLRYHLQVTDRVDNEVAKKKAIEVLHRLDNPAPFVVHQHAQISHDSQKTPVNENNLLLEKRNKQLAKEVENEKEESRELKENPNFKHLSNEETAAAKPDMEKQVREAAARTPDRPTWQPNVAPVAEVAPVKPVKASKPAATPKIPSWK